MDDRSFQRNWKSCFLFYLLSSHHRLAERKSPCGLGYMGQVGLGLTDLPAPAYRVLRLKALMPCLATKKIKKKHKQARDLNIMQCVLVLKYHIVLIIMYKFYVFKFS